VAVLDALEAECASLGRERGSPALWQEAERCRRGRAMADSRRPAYGALKPADVRNAVINFTATDCGSFGEPLMKLKNAKMS